MGIGVISKSILGVTDHCVRRQNKSQLALRKLTLYRDDSTTQVVFDNVKHFFFTANNSVLTIAQYTDLESGAHKYIHWPRERFCWFKDETQ